MKTKLFQIQAGEENLACAVNYAEGNPKPTVICLHGGGPSGMRSTGYLAGLLQKHGRSVVRFDFSGQGESSGVLAASSLKKRLLESMAVLAHFGMDEKISVIGTSMGGYIASALVQEGKVDKLALFCPAAYTPRAWEVPFGAGFTQIIREANSFLESDIQEMLSGYHGKALLITGSEDTIIPKGVIELYLNAFSQNKDFRQFVIPDCPHPIHSWAMKHPQVRENIEQEVLRWIF